MIDPLFQVARKHFEAGANAPRNDYITENTWNLMKEKKAYIEHETNKQGIARIFEEWKVAARLKALGKKIKPWDVAAGARTPEHTWHLQSGWRMKPSCTNTVGVMGR